VDFQQEIARGLKRRAKVKEVEIAFIRKMLERAADTWHSD
jgi:hypothetical protein